VKSAELYNEFPQYQLEDSDVHLYLCTYEDCNHFGWVIGYKNSANYGNLIIIDGVANRRVKYSK
jgi:hypothetical protein